jgi:chorismate mutase
MKLNSLILAHQSKRAETLEQVFPAQGVRRQHPQEIEGTLKPSDLKVKYLLHMCIFLEIRHIKQNFSKFKIHYNLTGQFVVV